MSILRKYQAGDKLVGKMTKTITSNDGWVVSGDNVRKFEDAARKYSEMQEGNEKKAAFAALYRKYGVKPTPVTKHQFGNTVQAAPTGGNTTNPDYINKSYKTGSDTGETPYSKLTPYQQQVLDVKHDYSVYRNPDTNELVYQYEPGLSGGMYTQEQRDKIFSDRLKNYGNKDAYGNLINSDNNSSDAHKTTPVYNPLTNKTEYILQQLTIKDRPSGYTQPSFLQKVVNNNGAVVTSQRRGGILYR